MQKAKTETPQYTSQATDSYLIDIQPTIAKTIANGHQKRFIRRWNGDSHIELTVNPEPFFVEDNETLQTIGARAASQRREIAFGGIIDEREQRILTFIQGAAGTRVECDWNDGNLIPQLHAAIAGTPYKYFLGHTHPRNYGAICSREYWWRDALRKYQDPISKVMVENERYKYFGSDFLEMRVRQWLDPKLSSYFWILSPAHHQAGLFRIAPESEKTFAEDPTTTYHPWHATTQTK